MTCVSTRGNRINDGSSLLETKPQAKLPCQLKWEDEPVQVSINVDVRNRNTYGMLGEAILRL